MRVVWGNPETSISMAAWVSARIPHMFGMQFGNNISCMVVDEINVPLGGVVYHNWAPHYASIDMSVASASPRWLTKKIISEIMAYPFDFAGVQRITVVTPADRSTSVWRFLERFPFTREGTHKLGLGTQDACTWRLLKSEWASHRLNVGAVKICNPLPVLPRKNGRLVYVERRPLSGKERPRSAHSA